MRAIAYRDLKAENLHGYESQEIQSGGMVVREMIVPGAFGFPPMYIRHLSLTYAGERVLIICQTDYELTPAKGVEILAGAVQFLEKNSQK